MAVLNPKEEIVFLLRGYFACPLISFLGKKGILNKMIDREFAEGEFKEIINKKIFHSIIIYFKSIGLIEKHSCNNKHVLTEMGEKIFKRYGSFCLLHSYGNFLDKLEYILFDKNYKGKACVERLENIIGSGHTNSRKYFPSAINMLKEEAVPLKIIDIGCGNGTFLKLVLENFSDCKLIGVDISEDALKETAKNIKTDFEDANVETILCNGRNVSNWLPSVIVRNDSTDDTVVITLWYFLHEISKNDPSEIVRFLEEIYQIAPSVDIIIGEITAVPEDVLVANKYESILPEYLFFHEISGQGILNWEAYKDIVKKVPYKIKNEKLFDILSYGNKKIPSGFVWHLTPKGDRRCLHAKN